MFHRTKRLNAFVVGCLASIVVFGYPSQLLAQAAPTTANIQGITSTTQSTPTTAAQVNDVVTGINAGVNAGSLISPAPDPIREHTAFLSSMWTELLNSNYIANTSYLTTDQWITGPTGTVTATNETGNTLTVDIALSLEILPDQYSFVDQASLDALASVSARMGMAWTTMTNVDQVQSNILVWWYQWTGPNGIETDIAPVTTLSQDNIDLERSIVLLMNDFFSNPLYYNIENYNPANYSFWSAFRTAMKVAVILAVTALVAATVVGGLAVVAAAAAEIGGVAAVHTTAVTAIGSLLTIIGTSIGVAGAMTAEQMVAYQQLRDDLENSGHDLTGMTKDQIIQQYGNGGV